MRARQRLASRLAGLVASCRTRPQAVRHSRLGPTGVLQADDRAISRRFSPARNCHAASSLSVVRPSFPAAQWACTSTAILTKMYQLSVCRRLRRRLLCRWHQYHRRRRWMPRGMRPPRSSLASVPALPSHQVALPDVSARRVSPLSTHQHVRSSATKGAIGWTSHLRLPSQAEASEIRSRAGLHVVRTATAIARDISTRRYLNSTTSQVNDVHGKRPFPGRSDVRRSCNSGKLGCLGLAVAAFIRSALGLLPLLLCDQQPCRPAIPTPQSAIRTLK